MNKIKVLQFPMANVKGGVTQYALNNWKFIDKQRFQFDFATLNKEFDMTDKLTSQGCKVHFISCYAEDNEEEFVKAINQILDENYDVLHLHTLSWKSFLVEEIAIKRKVPKIIVHSHNIMVDNVDEEKRMKALTLHTLKKMQFSMKLATDFCACSWWAADWLYGDQIPRDQIRILNNAIDLEEFSYNEEIRNEYRKQLGWEDKFILGNVGRFSYQKNHDFLLDVFQIIARKLPNARLMLIGIGELEERIREKAKLYQIDDKIIFLRKREDVSCLMQAMDVFLLPSRFEGLPIVLLEAQTAGLKCITSTAVTTESAITENIEFIPFDMDEWVDKILAFRQGYQRKNMDDVITTAGYNIRYQIKEIEKLYSDNLPIHTENGGGAKGYPLISIIVPIYKIEKYLRQCVESILFQTYKNIEIILVDDGSPDRCPEICDEFARIDMRVKVIHKENEGLVSARKAGLKLSTGTYITYLDGDDWIEPYMCEIMYYGGLIYGVDILSAGYVADYPNGISIKYCNKLPAKMYYASDVSTKILPMVIDVNSFFQYGIPNTVGGFIYKRELLYYNQMQVDNDIQMAEDMLCSWSCLLEAESVSLVDDCLYHYRKRNDSMINSFSTSQLKQNKSLFKHLKNKFVNHKLEQMLLKQLDYLMYFILFVSDYQMFVNEQSTYLFPFSKVCKGSNIIVYGAGAFGKQLIHVLEKTKFCNVILWVDRGYESYTDLEKKVDNPDSINALEYDFVVAAVTKSDVAEQIRATLLTMGVFEEKIAIIDLNVLTHDALPKELDS